VTVTPSFDRVSIAYRSLGAGEAVLVVGGALRRSDDYLALARRLAQSFTVHVVDRRGRGESGEQGGDYGIEVECGDLLAIQQATGARFAFGHSYGGLVCLETALRSSAFDGVAVFEPGVSVDGCMPASWLPRFRALLECGDDWGAMVCMAQGAGFAPKAISSGPPWLARLVMRAGVSRREWRAMRPLLRAQLAEMGEVAKLDGPGDRYCNLDRPVLLLGGKLSPQAITRHALEALNRTLPASDLVLFDRVGHTGPGREAPALVAERIEAFFLGLRRGSATRMVS
jgi:pimeloyl-ACP methyl ester carboxylesterase